jgi:hypothetical protein
MQNLIKIQEDLKNLPLQAVMSYVNGRNPMVPPYLALTELNRRKQMQQSTQANQQQPQQTVKDQVQQQAGLMALQAARQQAVQQNMQQGAAASPQPQALPVQGAPVQAAEGGLMRMPMRSDMFEADSYAGGGIVAFKRGGGTDEEEEEDYEDPLAKLSGVDKYSRAIDELRRITPKEQNYYQRTLGYKPERVEPAVAPVAPVAPAAPAAPAVNPNAPRPDGGVTNLGGYSSLMNMKPRSTSLEDIFKEQQAADKLAGVVSPDQRYAKSDEMLSKLREQMTGQRAGQERAGLAEAMGEGAQKRKWWEASGAFGGAQGKFRRSQDSLYNKQDEAFADLERTKEKEEDAIRRGNAKEIGVAKREREKAEFELNKAKAEVQYRQDSTENKGDVAQERLDLEKEKVLMKEPGYQNLVMKQTSLENRLRKDPNDQKAKQELALVQLEIDKKRREAGLSGRSGAPAGSAAQGKLVKNVDGSYSYQR